jgi:putative endopeptidase
MSQTETGSASVTAANELGIRPQDDFFRARNGVWLKNYQLPDDKVAYGPFNKLAEDSEKEIHEILEDPHTTATRSQILYSSYMDVESLEKAGAAPLQEPIARISSASTKEDLLKQLATLDPHGGPSPIGIFVGPDPHDPSTNIACLTQGGIGLPDESYYREDHYKPIREKYVEFMAQLFLLAGIDTDKAAATQRAHVFLDIETAIASHHWDNITDRDEDKTNTAMTFKQLTSHLSHYDIAAWARSWQEAYDTTAASEELPVNMTAALQKVIVREPDFLDGLDQEWQKQSLDAWKTWALGHILQADSSYLNHDFEQAAFDFYGTVLSGAKKMRDRWKRGVSLVNSMCGEDVGKVYVQRYFPASSKKQMETLVGNLLKAYHVSIINSTWLGEETKKKALKKLSLFKPMIGYTNHWRDYSGLKLDRDAGLMDNIRAGRAFMSGYEMHKAGKPVDREEWDMNPQEVNAYYEPNTNVIVFPAAILQPPFFDPKADPATNYGGIGAVIGHEIGHGFDDQGSKYDGEGKLHDWWTDSDRSNFEKLTHALISQYDQFVPQQLAEEYAAKGKPEDAPHVKGGLTIGENIGDLSGVNIALKAYVISLGLKADTPEDLRASLAKAPVKDGMTAAQRFFVSYAEIWREKIRSAVLERVMASDPHSPAEFRTNGIVRNVDAFYDAFDVKPTDKMWLDPAKRVHIW